MKTLQSVQSVTNKFSSLASWRVILIAMVPLTMLGACTSSPPRRTVERVSLPVAPAPIAAPKLYAYPTSGQNAEQQDRDRFECHQWAVKQTNYDPGYARHVPRERVEVVPVPQPGTHTAVGAVTGAVVGAAVASRHHTAEGAVIGAVAGAALGAVSDATRQEEAAQLQERYERRQDIQSTARSERQAQDFRRAMSACLEGRGYSVR